MNRERETMEILGVLSKAGNDKGVSFVLAGGHALNAYGVSRQTGDVDLLVCDRDKDAWKAILRQLGYELYHDHRSFMQFSAPRLDMWPVDLMLVDSKTFAGLVGESRPVELGSACVPVVSLEHLLALKLHALKQAQPHRELKDLDDVASLIESAEIDVRGPSFQSLCEKYGTREIHERIAGIIQRRTGS